MDAEKKKILEDIELSIIETYKEFDVPMIFKTKDCLDDEWIGKNLNTDKISKLKFSPSDGGTQITDLEDCSDI